RRIDRPGAERIDPDLVVRVVPGKVLHEGNERSLRGAVGRVGGKALETGDGGVDDDGASACLDEFGYSVAAEVVDAVQVDADGRVPGFEADLGGETVAENAGVGDEDGDFRESGDGGCHHRFPLGGG